MTLQERLEEILEDFNVWCLCDSRECQRSVNYKQAKRQIKTIIDIEKEKSRYWGQMEALNSFYNEGEISSDSYKESVTQITRRLHELDRSTNGNAKLINANKENN